MRLAIAAAVSMSLLGSPVCFASQTGMSWWNQNGDSVVLDGVTITLTGNGIQQYGGAVQDPPGSEDATFTFTFSPPIESFQMWIRSVAPGESIEFQLPFPSSVQGAQLVPDGTPIRSIRGFFPYDQNYGAVTWDGPELASVTFTMAHADGSIQLTQMGQAFHSELSNHIEMQATPAPGGVTVSLAISDAGRAPEIKGFVIRRQAIYPCASLPAELVHCITSRQPGMVSYATILDTNARPNTQYVYRVDGWSIVPCLPDGSQSAFLAAFDPTGWHTEILSFVSTGIVPIPIAHGRLVAVPEEGPNFVRIAQCEDSCNPCPSGWASGNALEYLGTDTEVLLYGGLGWFGNYYGYASNFTAAEPKQCTLSARSTTWSLLKQLYRSPAPTGR